MLDVLLTGRNTLCGSQSEDGTAKMGTQPVTLLAQMLAKRQDLWPLKAVMSQSELAMMLVAAWTEMVVAIGLVSSRATGPERGLVGIAVSLSLIGKSDARNARHEPIGFPRTNVLY